MDAIAKDIPSPQSLDDIVWRFTSAPETYGRLLSGEYDLLYVTGSLLIAALAAFATLQIVERLQQTLSKQSSRLWLTLACFTLSLGVWTMHFTGMIAFFIPVHMAYDPWLTAASVVPMLVGSSLALNILLAGQPTTLRIQAVALCLALGIGGMHYVGMEAMVVSTAHLYYDPVLFASSIVVAHVLACCVIWVYGIGSRLFHSALVKPITASLMGITISGMHYTAMLAASYVVLENSAGHAEAAMMSHDWLATAVLSITTLILLAIVVVSYFDAKLEAHKKQLEISDRNLARSERLVAHAGKLAGIGGWELEQDRLYLATNLRTLIPMLGGLAVDDFLNLVDADNQLHATGAESSGTVFAGRIEIVVDNQVRTFHSQCEKLADNHWLGYLQDVSKSVLREQALEEARSKAEEAATTRSNFVANMSHELRTPMNGVLGMASLLHQTQLTAEQRELLRVVHDSGETMLSVINEVLDFSKLDSEHFEIETVALDLEALAAGCLSMAAAGAVARGVTLHLTWSPDLSFGWYGDPVRLKQIFNNLISNAVKFTENGLVRVSLMPYDSGSQTENQDDGSAVGVQIQVEDQGIGMTAEQLAIVFEPFRQADASTTRKHGGTGLGLSITKGLIEAMQGSIGVTSEVRIGSTFTVQLPLRPQQNNVQPVDQLSDLSIAIVTPDALSLAVFESLAVFSQCSVRHFESLEALSSEYATGQPWDWVFVDSALLDNEVNYKASERALAQIQPSAIVLVCDHDYQVAPLSKQKLIRKPLSVGQISRFVSTRDEVPAVDQPQLPAETLSILVAEDNQVNQQVVLAMLNKLGFSSDLATDGVEACEAVAQKQYDLVLMDVQMPNMGGLEATRRIRQTAVVQPWIIAVTANASTSDRQRCLDAGVNEHLAKPMRIKELKAALSRVRSTPQEPLVVEIAAI